MYKGTKTLFKIQDLIKKIVIVSERITYTNGGI